MYRRTNVAIIPRCHLIGYPPILRSTLSLIVLARVLALISFEYLPYVHVVFLTKHGDFTCERHAKISHHGIFCVPFDSLLKSAKEGMLHKHAYKKQSAYHFPFRSSCLILSRLRD